MPRTPAAYVSCDRPTPSRRLGTSSIAKDKVELTSSSTTIWKVILDCCSNVRRSLLDDGEPWGKGRGTGIICCGARHERAIRND
jgi:hypothetical protein